MKFKFPFRIVHVLTSCIALYFALTPWLYSPVHIYKNVSESVVVIKSEFEHTNTDGTKVYGFSICSGVFTDFSHVLTNNHCVASKNPDTIWLKSEIEAVDGGKFAVHLQKSNRIYDLTLLELDNPKRGVYRAVKLGHEVTVGDTIYTLGHPHGIPWFISSGIAAKKLNDGGIIYILHTAPINPGSSGSPLLDKHGHLVGINEATLTWMGLPIWSGTSVAINLPIIKHFLYNTPVHYDSRGR